MKKDHGITSDQYVHSVATKKKMLTDQVISLIKSAAVDCHVYSPNNSCMDIPTGNLNGTLRTSRFQDDMDDNAWAKKVNKLNVVMVDGKKYYLDVKSNVFYDYEQLKKHNVLEQAKPDIE
jgi:hypothetical protein